MTRRMIRELYTSRVPSSAQAPIGAYERRDASVQPWDPSYPVVAARAGRPRPHRPPGARDRAHREHGGAGPAGQGDHRPRDGDGSGRDPGGHRGAHGSRLRAAAGTEPVAADPADARRVGRPRRASSTGSISTSIRAATATSRRTSGSGTRSANDPSLRDGYAPHQGRDRGPGRGPGRRGSLPGREGRLDPGGLRPARDPAAGQRPGRAGRRGGCADRIRCVVAGTAAGEHG